MRRVGYYHCPRCVAERLYVLHEPPWDEHMGECDDCGHVYGYIRAQEVITDEALATSRVEWRVRPVLSDEVLRAGILELTRRTSDRFRRNYGGTYAEARQMQKAEAELRAGLASEDPATRRQLLNSTAPSVMRRPKA